MLRALLGEDRALGRNHLVQQDNGSDKFGFRAGTWKLQRIPPARAAGNRRRNAETGSTVRLYDLTQDPGETTDVSAEHPEIAKRLNEQLEALIAAGRSRARK